MGSASKMSGFAGLLFAAAASAASASEASAPPRIPLVVGLTTVRSVVEPIGDYESINSVIAVGKDGYRFVVSAEVPDAPGGATSELRVVRKVLAEDQRHARVMRNRYNSVDPEAFAGTTPGISAAVLDELKTSGRASLTLIQVRMVFGMAMERPFVGTVTRVGTGPSTLAVLVNGRKVELPVVHAKGPVSAGGKTEQLEFQVLDNPELPLLLTSTGPGFSTQITRIEYPEPKGSPVSLERKLAESKPVDVYGIYFAFASATIRPESDPVLLEIADVLRAHPAWALQVDGHTDGIGHADANLDLSKRRSAAVKTALVQRYGIAARQLQTDGHGAAQPKDSNDTLEGRARNRRVELRRL
jgi:outer membrane protein OmpA-like peptidoglycan-associated protein